MNRITRLFIPILLIIVVSRTSAQENPLPIEKIGEHLKRDSLNVIEGYWNVSVTREVYFDDTLSEVIEEPVDSNISVVRQDEKYVAYFPDGSFYNVVFKDTEVKGVYLYRNYFAGTDEYSKPKALICKGSEIEYTFELNPGTIGGQDMAENQNEIRILKWTKKTNE